MQQNFLPRLRRGPLVAFGATALLLAACNSQTGGGGGFDWDLRSRSQFNTADAAAQASLSRPRPDARGVISYPGYQVVVAQRGESVGSVAARLGVNGVEMARLNAIQPDLYLGGGEVLLVPGRVAENSNSNFATAPATPMTPSAGRVDVSAIATTALDRVAATPAPKPQTQPQTQATPFTTTTTPVANPRNAGAANTGVEPARHRVVRGETAYIIARRYNVSARALAEWNGLGADMGVREGQTLLIPPADTSKPAPAPAAAVTTKPGTGSPTPQPPSAAKPLPKENPSRAGAGNTGAVPAAPSLPTTKSAAMAMPADGSIIRAYQKKKYDGVGIGAAAGSPVRAAAEGTVAAITRDTEQVPIVVIRHADNLLTVYANVDGVTVSKGAKVARGQQIGKVRPGNPSFLHFEVRRGSDSVDPMTMLK